MATLKISDVFRLQMGKTPSRKNPDYWKDGEFDWVSIADLGTYDKYVASTKERINELGVKESGIKAAPANTVLMSFKLSLGKTAITTKKTYTNEAIMAFIDKGVYEVDPEFVYHQFRTKDWMAGTNRAVMGATLSKATLSNCVMRLPSIAEQREIVARLNHVQNSIGVQKQQLAVLDDLVKARFIEMFEECDDSEDVTLEDCCASVSGGMTPSMKREEFYGGDIPFIKSGDVKNDVVSSGVLWLTKDALCGTNAKLVPEGAVIVVTRSGILKHTLPVAIAANPLVINQDLKALVPKDGYISQYLSWAIRSRSAELLAKVRATSVDNIETRALLNVPVRVVPLERQQEFAAFVAQADKTKAAVQQSIDKLQMLYDSLAQEYFGGGRE